MINPNDANLIIFDRKLPVFEKILGEIQRKKSGSWPFVVGITGIDSSGKTMFTDSLADFLVSKNRRVQKINLDDFHNPRQVRYAGDNQADNYYYRSFNIKTIIENLLTPARQKGEHSVTLTLLDLLTDKYEIKKEYSFNRDTIVLFEGVFLFRKDLAPYIDYKIFLDIPLEESKKRAAAKDIPIYGKEVLKSYNEKYLPAQARYLKDYPPQEVADMIIDNANWEHPYISHLR